MQMHDVPTIDVTGLRSGRHADLESVGRSIGEAARTIGFFWIVNYGLEREVENVIAEAQRFFALPIERKETVALQSYFNGYTRLGQEHGEPHEAFDLGPEVAADDPGVLAGTSLFTPRRWPDIPSFRQHLATYYDRGSALIIDLHRAIAVNLGADANHFTPYFPRMVNLRMLHYPPHAPDDERWGIGEHTDFGNLTLLAQDRHGLEVRTLDGRWIMPDMPPGALLCNIGDCLMRWSNDTYISTPHRVRNTTGASRHSVALFGDPDQEAVVACLPSCATADRPAKYPPVRFAEFANARFTAGYA
jgi:isopenicillin N synthase-like dioxygenase